MGTHLKDFIDTKKLDQDLKERVRKTIGAEDGGERVKIFLSLWNFFWNNHEAAPGDIVRKSQ